MILFRNVWKNKMFKKKRHIYWNWCDISQKVLPWPKIICEKTLPSSCEWPPLWIHSRAKNPQILKNHANLSLSFEFWFFDDLANVLHEPASLPPQTITASLWQLPTPMSTEHEAGMSEPTCSKPAARENFQYNPPNLWSWFPPNPVESVWVKTARGNNVCSR